MSVNLSHLEVEEVGTSLLVEILLPSLRPKVVQRFGCVWKWRINLQIIVSIRKIVIYVGLIGYPIFRYTHFAPALCALVARCCKLPWNRPSLAHHDSASENTRTAQIHPVAPAPAEMMKRYEKLLIQERQMLLQEGQWLASCKIVQILHHYT